VHRTDQPPDRGPGARALAGVGLVAFAFALATIARLDDFGLTWDEDESLVAGSTNLPVVRALLRGEPAPDWPWHELTGYQYLLDSVRTGFVRLAGPLLGGATIGGFSIRALHLFQLLVSAAVLAAFGGLAAFVTRERQVAVVATALFAASPRILANAASNPKDAIGLLVAPVLAGLTAAVLVPRLGEPTAPLAGAGLGILAGVTIANHVGSLYFLPVLALWLLLDRPARGGASLRALAAGLGPLFAAVPQGVVAAWPWLWGDPAARLRLLLDQVTTCSAGPSVFFLGQTLAPKDLPPYYFALCLLVATPFAFVLAALAAPALGPPDRERAGRRSAARLAAIWLAILLAAALGSRFRYNGVRHFLGAVPALALLAAVGLANLWDALGRLDRRRASRRARAAALALAAGLALWLLADLRRAHPYYDAYLSAPARLALAAAGVAPERAFELEFWGAPHREAALWLNSAAPARAPIVAPIASHCLAPYLRSDLVVVESDAGLAPGIERLVAFLVMEAFFSPDLRRLRAERLPAFAIRRHGVPLVEVYRVAGEGDAAPERPPRARRSERRARRSAT
jgi:hypothetical protein